MTSELKPFAYAYIGPDGQPDGGRFGTQPLTAGDIKAGYTQIELYTRAVPAVPGKNNAAHVLYKDGDDDAPNTIKDSNGDIALGLCRICGAGEIELEKPCFTPDVPELVEDNMNRYSITFHFEDDGTPYPTAKIDGGGEYVRYDQAAAMIAQTEDKWAETCDTLTRIAKDAQTELAKIKAQEPVVWRGKFRANSSEFWEYYAHLDSGFDPDKYEQQPLYATPVDQTAEIEGLREALTDIASFSQSTGLLWWQVRAREALQERGKE